MLVADINTLTNNTVDTERVDFMKRTQLETNFYNVFRNTIRILFNDYSNSKKRKVIQEECHKRYRAYQNQLDRVTELLHDLVEDNIVFADKYNYNEINENDIHTCITIKNDKCNVNGSVCKVKNSKCTLILPLYNLVNNSNNEEYYYGRMADELIRYNRIKSFIFKPKAYLSFGQIKYNLRDNEIIILEELLNTYFVENLIPANINEFAKYNTYDTVVPLISQIYNNELNYNDIINPKQFIVNENIQCIKTIAKISRNKTDNWRKCFPIGFKEIKYAGANDCSLVLIIDIFNKLNKTLTIREIKDDLMDEYKKLTMNFVDTNRIEKIRDILTESRQNDVFINYLHEGISGFQRMIYDNQFNAKSFDLWLLLVRYKIPSVFISNKGIQESRYNSEAFACYNEVGADSYVFIVIPALYVENDNNIPKYKLITDEHENIFIPLKTLECKENININKAIQDIFTVERYVDKIFEKDERFLPRKQGIRNINKRATLVLVDDIESEAEKPKIEETVPKIEEAVPKIEEPLKIEEVIAVRDIIEQMPIPAKPKNKSKKNSQKPINQTRRKSPPINLVQVAEL
jgi:hypothetical protein